ncbi:hypothetical protein BYT27DRAFT_6489477 [Phlegmacium glaucopus]|nr:hypothetical protein BYT27DRAFT_6489477 [Phlegmacium glaucopus]
MKTSTLLPLLFGIFTQISGTPLVSSGLETGICDGAVTLTSTWIGKAKNVEMKTVSCPDSHQRRDVLVQRQATNATNVCGAPCATNCFLPAGGGPDPNDCHVIADALRYDSQNIAALFQIDNTAGNNTVVMQFSSCKTFFVNQDLGPLVYCRTDWAALIDFVAPNCQATQNAHGGNCVANDQRWFVQVQHV